MEQIFDEIDYPNYFEAETAQILFGDDDADVGLFWDFVYKI